MSRYQPTEHDKNLNASNLFTVAMALLYFSRGSTPYLIMVLVGLLFAVYSWLKHFRLRRLMGCCIKRGLWEIFQIARMKGCNSLVLLQPLAWICLIGLGYLARGKAGAVAGAVLAAWYCVSVFVAERYPLKDFS